MVAVPLADIMGETVARALTSCWMPHFGVPSSVTSDSGRQFEWILWHELILLLGYKQIRIIAYHPSANCLVQRFHCQLKALLKAQTDTSNWSEYLPMVLLDIRTLLKKELLCTAAELVYGITLQLPGEFFNSSGLTVTLN